MNNTTYSIKKDEIQRKWYIIDATGKPLGRVASEAAKLLRGKHKPTYTPNMDVGDHVIILNCSKAVFTGHKLDQKIYRHHSGYIGGMKEVTARNMMDKNPEKAMMLAVKGMLPHNSLGSQMLKKLRVYANDTHENMAQKPEKWEM
ncbi:MAG: 50S ribosomal protein L13 [Clostridia bacterium]|nr:50S ribosomal protein L13 [Clostridia bacterium]